MSASHCHSVVSPLAWLAGVTLLLGCAGAPAAGSPDPAPPVTPPVSSALPVNSASVGDFVAHVSPRNRAVTFQRIQPARAASGLSPEDLGSGDALTIEEDGTPGTGSTGTVELATNTVGDNFAGDVFGTTCPGADEFCANVTLRSFLPRSLSQVYVQVSAIHDATGADLGAHDAVNGDASAFGLDATHGLWQYTGDGVSAPGVLGQDSPYNAGSLDWVFANPDDADTYIVLSVYAALGYTSYSSVDSSASFIDACALGSSTTSSSSSQTMPFGFGLWDTLSTTVNFDQRGVVTLGATSGTASGDNVCLPDASAPAPALFVFWDDLTFGAGGQMCWATVGSEPNRQFVIEWSNMDFASDDPGSTDVGSSLTFEAILSEGTDEADFFYETMTPPSGSSSTRWQGSSATIGTQDSGATAGQGLCNAAWVGGGGGVYGLYPSP